MLRSAVKGEQRSYPKQHTVWTDPRARDQVLVGSEGPIGQIKPFQDVVCVAVKIDKSLNKKREEAGESVAWRESG